MRIELHGAERVTAPPAKTGPDDNAVRSANAPTTAADGVALSSAAQELRAYQRAAQDAPDVRDDLVAELKAKIAAGQYHPPAEEIARKMLGS
jgi:negative regulator of flagellin synthesis FlgM